MAWPKTGWRTSQQRRESRKVNMPIVSKKQAYVLGVKTYLTISVSPKGVFTARIPDNVREILCINDTKVEAATLSACEGEWNRLKREAEAASTTVEKVILYRLSLNDGTKHKGDEDFTFANGYVLGIEVGVYEKTVVALAGGEKRASYAHQESSIPCECISGSFAGSSGLGESARMGHDNVIELPWTEAREKFFCDIAAAMKSMMTRLKSLSTPEKMRALSANGNPRLLLPGDMK